MLWEKDSGQFVYLNGFFFTYVFILFLLIFL